jgi:dynein heavy chain
VQKGLNQYLEKKRSLFARFYFLSDGELLEILSQTKEVRRVRAHLRKVFEAVNDLEFRPNDDMVAMMSVEGEKIELVKKVSPTDRNVEFWMGDVEKQMCISVRHVFEQGLKDYAIEERNKWVISNPGQIVLNASQVYWTKEVEECLTKDGLPGLKNYLKGWREQLNSTVLLVREKLTKLAKISVNALIVIDVHARTVLEEMVDSEVSDANAFEWIK